VEQVQQPSCEPLLKKVLTLSEGQNSSCIVDRIRLARKPRGCRGCGDTSGQARSSNGSGFRCACFHTTEAGRWAGPAAARFRLKHQTRWKLPLSLRRTQKSGCQLVASCASSARLRRRGQTSSQKKVNNILESRPPIPHHFRQLTRKDVNNYAARWHPKEPAHGLRRRNLRDR